MGKGRRRHQEAPHIQPVDVDGVRTVSIFTVLWAVAFVVLAFNRERLDEAGTGWLLWTCLAGVGLGLLGIEYTRKRREAITLSQLEEDEDDAGEPALDEDRDDADDDDAQPLTAEHESPPAGPEVGPVAPAATSAHGDPGPSPTSDTIPTKPIPRSNRARPEPKPPEDPPATEPPPTSMGRPGPFPPHVGHQAASHESSNEHPDQPLSQPQNELPNAASETPEEPVAPQSPAAPVARPAAPLAPADPAPTEHAQPQPPPGGRRRRQSKGPDRPGRVDVGDVSDLAPHIDPAATSAPDSDPPSPDTGISPMWSDLLDTTAPRSSAPGPTDPDEPLLDDTTLGGRRAKRYDMQEDIDEITDGGGGVYRGRRARRRPDSA